MGLTETQLPFQLYLSLPAGKVNTLCLPLQESASCR